MLQFGEKIMEPLLGVYLLRILEQEVVAILAKAEIQVVAGLVLVVSWILFDRMITRLKQRVK